MPGRPEAIRVAAVALLLVVAAIELQARRMLPSTPSAALASASGHAVTAVLAAVEGAGLAGCAVLVILLLRGPRRRRPADEDFEHVPWRPPTPWWVKALVLAAALAMLAAPIAALVATAGRRSPAVRGTAPAAPLLTPRPVTGHAVPPGSATAWPAVAGFLLAIAALVALAVVVWCGRRKHEPVPSVGFAKAPDDESALTASLLAGTGALRAARGPGQAIIDCYAAMERGLAEAGTPPAAADTPGELIARAAARGVVRGTAAVDLTGLFRRARYSPHDITDADRAAAAAALARLRSDLGVPPA